MKKILRVTIPVLAIGIFISLNPFGKLNEEGYEEEYGEEKEEKGPGYFDFIREVKGEAPANIVNLWETQSRSFKKNGQALDSFMEVGPYNIGGRTRAVVVDKSNADRIFVGAISGGMWVSEAAGKNWKAINDGEITLNISHMSQSPVNPDIIYYSTGEGAGNSGAAPGAGIFKSTDHGKTFTQLQATVGGTYDYSWRIACSPVDEQVVYVGLNSGGVYRSKDGGQSFERVVFTSRAIYDIELFADSSVMISIRGQGVYKSPNGDDGSWILLNNGLPSGTSYGRTELAYCETQPNTIYAAVSSSGNNSLVGLYRSNDGGASWTATAKNPTVSGGQFPFTWYCLALDVKQDDPDAVIIGSVNLLYSMNGGSTWTKASQSHADYHVMVEHPSRPGKIWIGNDGGLHEYDWNSLNQYVDLNEGLNITQFYAGAFAPEGISVMAGAQDNGTNFTFDGDKTFIKAYGGDGSYTQISQQNPTTAYLSYQNGMIFRVNNFGTTMQTTTSISSGIDLGGDGAWFIHPFEINMQDGDMVFFPTKKRVYRSTNAGSTFEIITNQISPGTGIQPFCVGVSNQKNPVVYVGGSNSLFYRIPKAGTATIGDETDLRSYVPSALRTSFMGCIKVNPLDRTQLYLSYTNYSSVSRVWKVIHADSIPEFIDISGNLPKSMPVNWVEVDPASPDSVIFAGTDRGLFYTQDGGQTWYQEEAIPNVVVDMLRVRESDRRLFIYTHGRGIFSARITPYNKAIPDHDILGIQALAKVDVKVFPNPVIDFVSLNWTENPEQTKSVQVFDAQGRQVFSGELKNNDRIDTRTWKPGIYVLSGAGIKSKKLQVRMLN